MNSELELLHLYRSPGHNYFGHNGQPPGQNAMEEVEEIFCVAGRGVEGDRFFDYREDYKGQITFFSDAVYQTLCAMFRVWDKPPSVFRRNAIVRGAGLNSLIGREFEIQGVWFFGVESCKPCYWMDQAFCPGAEKAMQGRGGLRARILTSGVLSVTPKLMIHESDLVLQT